MSDRMKIYKIRGVNRMLKSIPREVPASASNRTLT